MWPINTQSVKRTQCKLISYHRRRRRCRLHLWNCYIFIAPKTARKNIIINSKVQQQTHQIQIGVNSFVCLLFLFTSTMSISKTTGGEGDREWKREEELQRKITSIQLAFPRKRAIIITIKKQKLKTRCHNRNICAKIGSRLAQVR